MANIDDAANFNNTVEKPVKEAYNALIKAKIKAVEALSNATRTSAQDVYDKIRGLDKIDENTPIVTLKRFSTELERIAKNTYTPLLGDNKNLLADFDDPKSAIGKAKAWAQESHRKLEEILKVSTELHELEKRENAIINKFGGPEEGIGKAMKGIISEAKKKDEMGTAFRDLQQATKDLRAQDNDEHTSQARIDVRNAYIDAANTYIKKYDWYVTPVLEKLDPAKKHIVETEEAPPSNSQLAMIPKPVTTDTLKKG